MACMEWNCKEYWHSVYNKKTGYVYAKFKDFNQAKGYIDYFDFDSETWERIPMKIRSSRCDAFYVNNKIMTQCPKCGGTLQCLIDEEPDIKEKGD